MEVRNLLSWAMLETLSCGSEHLSPRRCTPVVVPMTPTPEARGTTLVSRHLLSGKCWGGRSLSRGHPHQHLPNCFCFQDWQHYFPGGFNGAPDKCQQSPQGFADHQSIHRCLEAEGHLGTWYGTLSKWVQSNQIHQRSQKPLVPRPIWMLRLCALPP